MAEYEFLKVAREGRLTVVTIDRPEVHNALHSPAHFEFDAVFDDFAADPEQWVAIVTGAGDKAFSAGNDLKYQAAGGPRERPATGFAGLTQRFDLAKPLIAAVNGFAMGGGFEIALACDLIVASDNAVFALPEPRVGLAALAGGLHRLPRIIPQKQALGMILTGRRVSAEEGERLGFVNEVTSQGELMNAAKRWAASILECSPMSIRASKQAIYRGLDKPTLGEAIAGDYPRRAGALRQRGFRGRPEGVRRKAPAEMDRSVTGPRQAGGGAPTAPSATRDSISPAA